MRSVLIVTLVLVFTVLVVLIVPREDGDVVRAFVTTELDEPIEGVVCCTFERDGLTRSCAVPDVRSCDVCEEVCDSAGE